MSASVEGLAWADAVVVTVAVRLSTDVAGNDTVDVPATGEGARNLPRDGVLALLDSLHSSKDISAVDECLKLDFSGIGGAVHETSSIEALVFRGTKYSPSSVYSTNFAV